MLIILYGAYSKETNGKHQALIDGKLTCGYRDYAEKFGHIIYLNPVTTHKSWEHSFTIKETIQFINKNPDAIVWSVKHDPVKDEHILKKIKNKKVYYSCNARNMYNPYCHISLVDTQSRVKENAVLWAKGKDPNFWYSSENTNKIYDYVLVGKRGDKNEVYFISELEKLGKTKRVVWVGGLAHKDKLKGLKSIQLTLTPPISKESIRDYIVQSKIGILFTELTVEGFPQTYLEMTMCGVPVIYNIRAPWNKYYFGDFNKSILVEKQQLIDAALIMKNKFSKTFIYHTRKFAIDNYSLDKSYERIAKCLK